MLFDGLFQLKTSMVGCDENFHFYTLFHNLQKYKINPNKLFTISPKNCEKKFQFGLKCDKKLLYICHAIRVPRIKREACENQELFP